MAQGKHEPDPKAKKPKPKGKGKGLDTDALVKGLAAGSNKKKAGYGPAFDAPAVYKGPDAGTDYQGKVGSHVLAIGDAVVIYAGNARGFGQMIIYQLTSGPYKGRMIYVGHAKLTPGLSKGDVLHQGDKVATLSNQIPGSTAKTPGWVEIGEATASGPKYASDRGSNSIGAAAIKRIMGIKLTQGETAAWNVSQATATAQQQASSPAFNDASALAAAARAQAIATQHVSDPWVVMKMRGGKVVGFDYAMTPGAPKNVLKTPDGTPLTKADLNNFWNSRYAGIFEAFTGRNPTAADMATTIRTGLSPYGLQAKLSALPSFKNSPIYKKNVGSINSVAQSIIGGDAPPKVIAQAIAEGWDQSAIEQHLKGYIAPDGSRPYLKGPEFLNKTGAMTSVYQKIYGRADAAAQQSIKEAAASGWDEAAFSNYLRNQPQYKTSVEYQSHAMNFMDQMGMLLKARPTLLPGSQPPVGTGTATADSNFVPGHPAPLNPVLNTTPGLAPVHPGE